MAIVDLRSRDISATLHGKRGRVANRVAYQDLSFDNQQSAIDNHQS
jgi:hypothetical protein